MKLYMHPASTTSRAVMLFIADNKIPVDMQVVDIFTGEHMKEPYAGINPSKLIPLLEDGGFRLSESSAILKYLADRFDLPSYPKDLKRRARVNEVMDWFNSNLYRDWGYGLIYPQIFPSHKRPSEEAHSATIYWGKDKAKGLHTSGAQYQKISSLSSPYIHDGPRAPFLCTSPCLISM